MKHELFCLDEPENPTGGARRDRTDDLLLAKQALSQLSYGPKSRCPPSPSSLQGYGGQPSSSTGLPAEAAEQRRLVGLGRLELPTSRLSSARSNQLSYKPAVPSQGPIHLDRPLRFARERSQSRSHAAKYGTGLV